MIDNTAFRVWVEEEIGVSQVSLGTHVGLESGAWSFNPATGIPWMKPSELPEILGSWLEAGPAVLA